MIVDVERLQAAFDCIQLALGCSQEASKAAQARANALEETMLALAEEIEDANDRYGWAKQLRGAVAKSRQWS